VSRACPSCTWSILAEIYLRHACSYQEIEDGNAWTGEEGKALLFDDSFLVSHPPVESLLCISVQV
jgi:hypothetical protein